MIKRIQDDLIEAMKRKDSTTLNVLRAIKSACTTAAIVKGSVSETLTDLEVVGIIRKQHAQRDDAAKQFTTAGRHDLAAKEKVEQTILERYLPQELPENEIVTIIDEVIGKIENPTIKNMGQIMKEVTTIVDGRADNKKISELIRSKLS